MPRRCFFLLYLQAALLSAAHAVTVRDDVTDATSQTLASDSAYASVGMFTRSDNDITSGVLINQYYVLTAAHIIQGFSGTSFTFTIGGLVYSTVGYTISAEDDLAIFQLATPVLNVTPALVYTGSAEAGKTATIVGYGVNGNGSTGGTGSRGTKHAATNVIDALSARLLGYDFDSGLAGDNTYGTTALSTYEGLIALGDSGGGTFATIGGTSYLIGIHSGVGLDSDGISYNYGDQGVDVRVSAASSFIQSNIPEPTSLLLVGAGVGILATQRRRRRGN